MASDLAAMIAATRHQAEASSRETLGLTMSYWNLFTIMGRMQ